MYTYPTHARVYVAQLLELGSNVEHENQRGETAMHVAISNKNLEAVEDLLEYGADPFCGMFAWQ